MSTRSVIAFPDGKTWKGRKVHLDGNPVHQLPALVKLVQRDGLLRAQKVVTENAVWSQLAPETRGRAVYNGFIDVPGYGVAYDMKGPRDRRLWATPLTVTDADWAYVLDMDVIFVLVCVHYWSGSFGWELVGSLTYDGLTDELAQQLQDKGDRRRHSRLEVKA